MNPAGLICKLDCNWVWCGLCRRDRQASQGQDKRRSKWHCQRQTGLKKVYNHVNETVHSLNFDNVSVLDYWQSVKVRLQLACIHTELQSNSIIRSLWSVILDPWYNNLWIQFITLLLTETRTVKDFLRPSFKRILSGKRLIWLGHSNLGRLTHFWVGMCQFVVTGVNLLLLLQNSSQWS